MRARKYFFTNNFPVWELILTLLITMTTVYIGKTVSGGATIFNFVPFIIITLMCWGYVIFKMYIFIRIYLSDTVLLGEVFSISGDVVKIGFLDIAQNKVIVAVGVHSKYSHRLAADMPIHFKVYGKWIEILETNEYYGAYKKSEYFESYDLIGRLMMKVFEYLDKRLLI